MCGLTGFYPKKGKKVNLNALFFLAIANEERGTDSCGMSVGWEVFKGVTKEAKARDFIMENKASLRKLQYKDKPIIFHTRKSTKGAHSEFNAHPFVYWWKDDKDEYQNIVLAHNGVIRNDLAIYNKNLSFSKTKYYEMTDSRIIANTFAEMFNQKREADMFELLRTYEGAAAMLYYINDTFYVWKGGAGDKEERPMYYIETNDGWYFHSIPSILYIMFNEVPTCVDNNTLLMFKDGAYLSKHFIERESSLSATTTFGKTAGTAASSESYCGSDYDYGNYQRGNTTSKNSGHAAKKVPTILSDTGKFQKNGTFANEYVEGEGWYCKGFATSQNMKITQEQANVLWSCKTREEFEAALLKYDFNSFVSVIPIINANKVVALYDTIRKVFIEEGETFKVTRLNKTFSYENFKIIEVK